MSGSLRRNSDEELRDLERRAKLGDPGAARKLRGLRRRLQPKRSRFWKFATWDEIALAIGWGPDKSRKREASFTPLGDSCPYWMIDQADYYADNWIGEFEKDENVELTDDQKRAVTDQFIWAVERHWLAESLLKNKLDKLFDPINEWANQPIEENEEWYYHPPKIGTAIEWEVGVDQEGNDGVWFKALRPILRVLQDTMRSDGGRGVSTVDLDDVVRLSKEIFELRHGGFSRRRFMEIDERYGEQMDFPNDKDIVAGVLEAGPLLPNAEDDDEED